MSKTIVKIRASSLSNLFDCAARFEATQILGMKMPSNPKAIIGTAVHAGAAKYDQSVLDGTGLTIDECKDATLEAIYKPDQEVDWEDKDISTPQEAEKIALSLHDKYCKEIAPQMDYAAVEVKCDSLVITDLGLELTGTADRIYSTKSADFGVLDLKTGKTVVGTDGSVATKGHAYQLGIYELMAESASGIEINAPAIIAGMNTAKTSVGQRVGLGNIVGAREVLIGNEESPGVLEIASKMIHAGLFAGNPKSMMCNSKYCPLYNKCKFRK